MSAVWKFVRVKNESSFELSEEVASLLNRMGAHPGEVIALQQHPESVHLLIHTDKDPEEFMDN